MIDNAVKTEKARICMSERYEIVEIDPSKEYFLQVKPDGLFEKRIKELEQRMNGLAIGFVIMFLAVLIAVLT
jgi:hypothetical protein